MTKFAYKPELPKYHYKTEYANWRSRKPKLHHCTIYIIDPQYR